MAGPGRGRRFRGRTNHPSGGMSFGVAGVVYQRVAVRRPVEARTVMSRTQGARRLYPSWWDHQRHVLKRLRCSLENLLRSCVVPGATTRVVALGCGDRPYEPILRE